MPTIKPLSTNIYDPDNPQTLYTGELPVDGKMTALRIWTSSAGAPGVTNDVMDGAGLGQPFETGDFWHDTASKVWYTCEDNAEGVADWNSVTSSSFASGITTDTISEFTSAAGVTVDSVLLKDGEVGGDLVSTAALKNGVVATTQTAADNSTKIATTAYVDDVIPRSTVARWNTVNGFGSNSTKIQKFSVELESSDDVVITVVNSATTGFSITANMACYIFVQYVANFNAGSWFGLTKNSVQPTENLTSSTAANILCMGITSGGDAAVGLSFSGVLAASDFIWPHTNGAADSSGPARAGISVLAIEKL